MLKFLLQARCPLTLVSISSICSDEYKTNRPCLQTNNPSFFPISIAMAHSRTGSGNYIPDTPHDRISHLLSQALAELESKHKPNAGSDLQEAIRLVEEARQVVDGYDSYAAEYSSPHPAIVDEMVEGGDHRDWEKVFREGKTQFRLIPEMSAGGYEAVVLQQLAKISQVCCVYHEFEFDTVSNRVPCIMSGEDNTRDRHVHWHYDCFARVAANHRKSHNSGYRALPEGDQYAVFRAGGGGPQD